MRRARPATDAATRSGSADGPLCLAGLFLAVWALVIQISLPLAIQLAPETGINAYDLAASVSGRIHSGHGNDSNDHSLPVRSSIEGILVSAETPVLHVAAAPVVVPYDTATAFGCSARPHQVVLSNLVHHKRLTRAPPSFGQVRQIT